MTWLQKRKLAKKKKERKNEKHTSDVAVYHFLPDPPKVTSCRAPEVAVRKGGQWWMRKCGRWYNSKVAMKKTLIKCD